MKLSLSLILIFLLGISFSPVLAQTQSAPAGANDAKEMRLTMSDGTQLYVKVSGKGRPCLFIHGGPGAWSHSFEVLGINTLEDSLQMVYVDQRGSGRSGKAPTGNYSLQRTVQDFDEVRQQLGFKQWTVLAHSFGGILATEYAYYHPKTISRMVLLNATLNLNYSAQVQIDKGLEILKPENPAPFLDQSKPVIDRFMMMIQALNEKDKYHQLMYTTSEGLRKMNEEDAKRPPNYSFGQAWMNYPEYFQDFTEVTRHLKMPVLAISGKQDFSIGPEHYKSFKFPNQTSASMPGGHVIYLEQNAQFQKTIKEFLKKTSKKS